MKKFITISTLLFGCFGLVIKYCLKSKCDNIKLKHIMHIVNIILFFDPLIKNIKNGKNI